jgi:4-hydroxy-4-methyl-2-oxoglutarate aldolase
VTDAARGHSAATVYEASPSGHACDSGIRPVWPGARLAGPAFTVQGIGGDNLALHRAVATAPAGSVLVVDLQGAAHGHWGEILAAAAGHRGILGLFIDGGVRDVAEQAALSFPVFARHVTVVDTGKEHPGRFGVPVRVGGVVVRPGDLVVGDADGVVVIPAQSIDSTLERADARVAAEQRALQAIRSGITTVEYYNLPTGFDEAEAQGQLSLRVGQPRCRLAQRADQL